MKPHIYKKDSSYYCALNKHRCLKDHHKVGKGTLPATAYFNWQFRNHLVGFS